MSMASPGPVSSSSGTGGAPRTTGGTGGAVVLPSPRIGPEDREVSEMFRGLVRLMPLNDGADIKKFNSRLRKFVQKAGSLYVCRVRDETDRPLVWYAADCNDSVAVELLLGIGAQSAAFSPTASGRTPYQHALDRGHTRVLSVMRAWAPRASDVSSDINQLLASAPSPPRTSWTDAFPATASTPPPAGASEKARPSRSVGDGDGDDAATCCPPASTVCPPEDCPCIDSDTCEYICGVPAPQSQDDENRRPLRRGRGRWRNDPHADLAAVGRARSLKTTATGGSGAEKKRPTATGGSGAEETKTTVTGGSGAEETKTTATGAGAAEKKKAPVKAKKKKVKKSKAARPSSGPAAG